MKFKEINFDELFIFSSINSGITEEFILNNSGEIPVYGSRKDGKPIGYINHELPLKYFQNCISWNRNGSVGYTFYRDHIFITSDDHRPLYIKDEHKDKLDVLYLRYLIQKIIFANGFAWDNKAGVDKMKLLYLPIPIKEDGGFDLEAQQKIAKRYERIEKFQNVMKDYLKTIKNCVIKVEHNKNIQYKNVDLKEIGKFIKGNSKYTSKYCFENKGEYPVYSASTKSSKTIGYINSYDFDIECLRITTNGYYASTVDYLSIQKFSINGDAGIFILDQEYSDKIDYRYLAFILKDIRSIYGFGWENKPLREDIENLSIEIPIKQDGTYDLEEQQRIAKKYQNIESKRSQAIDMLKRVIDTQVKITME